MVGRVTTKLERTKKHPEGPQADLTRKNAWKRENSWKRLRGLGVKDDDPAYRLNAYASIKD
jgi:hypothetical protein